MKKWFKNLLSINKLKYISFITFAIIIEYSAKAQIIANEVTNGGFEKLIFSCTNKLPRINLALGWRTIDSSITGGVQLLNKCLNNIPYGGTTNNFQYPFKGDGFGGATFYCPPPYCPSFSNRYYFRNRLKKELETGKTYCVKFYYVVSNASSYGISDIAAYFGDDNLDTIKKAFVPLNYLNPQIKNAHGHYATDTLNWTALTGTFMAQGIEKHVVIGNFTANSLVDTILINPSLKPNTVTDICIDHVSCIPIDLAAYAGPDKSCIAGDSVFVGREPDVEIDESCVWYKLNNNGTLSAPIDTVAGLYIKPKYLSSNTETFVVRQQLWCSGVKWDTVLVHQDFVGFPTVTSSGVEKDIRVFPNPSAGKITFEYKNELQLQYISITNLLSEEVLMISEPIKEIDISFLPTGLYYLRIETNKGATVFKLQKE